MKVCILSDSHDNRKLMDAAVADAVQRGVEAILHCGDLVAPSTLNVLQKYDLPIHVIHGNNSGDLYTMSAMAAKHGSLIHYYGQDAGIDLAGRRIFLVHYPHYGRAMATTGDWDLVCCGHSHVAVIEQIENIKGGSTPCVNPGTVGGVGKAPSYVLADLAGMTFEIIPVAMAEAA